MSAAHDFAAPNEAYAAAMELSRITGQLLTATTGHAPPAIKRRIPALARDARRALATLQGAMK